MEQNLFTCNETAVVASDRVLYTASPFARSSLLHLQEIGNLEAKRAHTSERSGLQSYLFFVVLSGSGALVYEGRKYDLKQNECVFINCRRSYAHMTDSDDLWKLSWCHFYGPSLPSVYDKYCERGGRPVFAPDEGSFEDIKSVLAELMSIARSSDYMRDMRINEILSRLLTLIMSESWHPESRVSAPKRAGITNVKEYIDQHYVEKITLDDLSKRFFIDKFYLAKTFRNRFGIPISAYIQSVRITKAKQLLRFSSKTIEEIGCEVGVDNPAYFSRMFKNVEGVSPKMYRDQW